MSQKISDTFVSQAKKVWEEIVASDEIMQDVIKVRGAMSEKWWFEGFFNGIFCSPIDCINNCYCVYSKKAVSNGSFGSFCGKKYCRPVQISFRNPADLLKTLENFIEIDNKRIERFSKKLQKKLLINRKKTERELQKNKHDLNIFEKEKKRWLEKIKSNEIATTEICDFVKKYSLDLSEDIEKNVNDILDARTNELYDKLNEKLIKLPEYKVEKRRLINACDLDINYDWKYPYGHGNCAINKPPLFKLISGIKEEMVKEVEAESNKKSAKANSWEAMLEDKEGKLQ